MNRNGRSRIPDTFPEALDVPDDEEPTPQEKAARAERRRERWEITWSILVLVSAATVAVASVVACVALRDVGAEQRRVNALDWTKK
jgi:hypothetical protein